MRADETRKQGFRGQAAMEYLMTYGWAILVIVIVLAALLFLGVFSVGSNVPEECIMESGWQCKAKLNVTSAVLNMTLTNGRPNSITVNGTYCTDNLQLTYSQITGAFQGQGGVRLDAGQTVALGFGSICYPDGTGTTAITSLTIGQKKQLRVFIKYIDDATSDIRVISTTTVTTTAQP